MKKRIIALIAALLSVSMIGSAFASCSNGNTTDESNEASVESSNEATRNDDTTEGIGSDTEIETGGQNPDEKEDETSMLDCDNAATIEYAYSILNGVNYYYPSAKRESAVLENMEMILEYGLLLDGQKKVTSLTNKNGGVYIENTMDAFIRMNDGETYFASATKAATTSNLFRFGYYFYEARYEGQDFLSSAPISLTKDVKLAQGLGAYNNDVTLVSNDENGMVIQLTNDGKGVFDPYITLGDATHNSKKDSPFTLLEITLKADAGINKGQMYLNTGSGFNNNQCYRFTVLADGNYHTYTIPLFTIEGYEGKITGIRFDLDGKDGNTYTIKEVNLVAADIDSLPSGLSIARSFMTYSDKMHHVLQVSAQTETANIKEVGILTNINADTVDKLIVKDTNGTHYTIDGVDWATVEYIGFDIKNAGIFGYILPFDGKGGTLKVTLSDGVYAIEQVATPEGGVIKPSEEGTNNANDFYIGQRIYTDDNHDFTEFLYEAECERHPLEDKYIKVNTNESVGGDYLGYDSLRGIYTFLYKCKTSGPNDYPNVKFSIKGDNINRKIYVMAYSDSSAVVESTVLLNDDDMMLAVPIEVGKNFSEASGERNLYNIDDPVYSESIFPLVLNSGEMNRYNVINIYRKWGRFPLKQISWIQFWAPYYHLSTGVTETNCITPYYATRKSRDLNTLPDFRAMSAPAFSGDQKNSGGSHHFLKYTDADGNFITSENTKNTVGFYGPTYADVTMDYISDDGKIKITYNHMEMPQTDENRTYYEMSYEILEDVSFKDFAKDFSFYSVRPNDPTGVYTLVGYLDEDNEPQVVNAKMAGDEAVYYTLGDNAPYFSYMKMTEDRSNGTGYVNLAFLVYETEFIIGGEKAEPNFVLADLGGSLSISLDYGEITLKKGDKIKINCILMPWGSQETIYDGSNGLAPDQNVRDVRQNTILDPLKATAVADCEVIETVYVPMLKTTNGKSAEFTLSGGHNNCAVRIYGFDMLTVPKIYELIDGEWVDYRVASGYFSYNPETSHQYDGYGVFYDGDGTFSYSFISEMNNGEPRTFKIVADKQFTSWQEIDPADIKSNAVQNEYINILVSGENLYNASEGAKGFGSIEYLEKYDAVRFYADPDSASSYFTAFQSNIFETGDYFVFKYRISNTAPTTFKFYTSTFEAGETYDNHHWSSGTLIRDGKWHVLVIDISEYEKAKAIKFANQGREYYNTFPTSDTDGNYYASFVRFDIFNQNLPEGTYVDIQYIGFSNDLEKIKAYNQDLYDIQLSSSDTSKYELIPTGGNPPVEDTEESTTVETEPVETEPVETEPEEIGNEMNLVVGNEDLYNYATGKSGAATGFSDVKYFADEGFTRFTNTSGSEGHFNVFNNNTSETGKYLVIKYRMPSNNLSKVSTFRFHISTTQTGMAATNNFYSSATLVSDDNWHVLVINMEKYENERSTTNEFLKNSEDGKYYAKFLKLFIFADKNFIQGTYIDIEYVAMCNSFGTIKNTNKDIGAIHLSETNSGTPKYVGKVNEYRYLDPTSDYTLADNYYCFHVDKINGNSTDANGNKNSYNSVSVKGVTEKNLNETVTTTLSVGGWCPVESGTSKYLWSVDGKNWYECGLSATQSGTTVLNAASGMMSGAYTFTETDGTNGQYSITINLSAYAGQTVDVRIAAVPADSDGSAICVLTSINGVTVSDSNGGNTDSDNDSGHTTGDKYFCFHVDKINGVSNSYNSISSKGITEKNLNETLSGTNLTIMGWCPFEGGAEKYIWSVDGENWYDCVGSTSQSGSTVLNAASGMMSGAYAFTEADGVNGQYSFSIDLSAYAGQTVNVKIAAVPKDIDGSAICILTSINGVTVAGN